jgi:hypothetical protein
MNRPFRRGDLVYHQRLGRGTIVEQWAAGQLLNQIAARPRQ